MSWLVQRLDFRMRLVVVKGTSSTMQPSLSNLQPSGFFAVYRAAQRVW